MGFKPVYPDFSSDLVKGTFMWAVEQMKQEKKIRRKYWKDWNGFCLYNADGIGLMFSNNRHISDKLAIEDIEATDWEIYDGLNLEDLKTEYKNECAEKRDCLTYRGLLQWLKEKGKNIDYIEGMQLGLLDFNNALFNQIYEEPLKIISDTNIEKGKGVISEEWLPKCQNCKEKLNEEDCKKDFYEGLVVMVCPFCRHGNY